MHSFKEKYAEILDEIGSFVSKGPHYSIEKKEPWCFFRTQNELLPAYGWKVHVSLSIKGLCSHFKTLINILEEMGLSFKTPLTFHDLVNLNSGLSGDSQVGKLFTCYTIDEKTTLKLLCRLETMISDHEAPKVPFDYYYDKNHCFSIRFGEIGAIKPEYDLCGRSKFYFCGDSEGPDSQEKWQDLRDGGLPSHISLPLWNLKAPSLLPSEEDIKTLNLGFPFKVARSYGRKYKRIFLLESDQKQFFLLKQAYRFGGESEPGQNYERMLANEFSILNLLKGQKIAPEPISYFTTQNYAYLLTEDLVGDSCDKLPPLVVQKNLDKLVEKIKTLHSLNYIHRDLKLSNILFLPKEEDFRLIDFELACAINQPLPCSGGTQNYQHPRALVGQEAKTDFDWFSFRSIIVNASVGTCPSSVPLKHSDFPLLLETNGYLYAAQSLNSADPLDTKVSSTNSDFSEDYFKKEHPLTHRIDLKAVQKHLTNTPNFIRPFAISLDDDTLAWRNEHLESRVMHQSINIGAAGILLGLIDLHRSFSTPELTKQLLGTVNFLQKEAAYQEAHGMMTGNAGVAVALAAAQKTFPDLDLSNAINQRLEIALTRQDEPDFFFGMAGILYAHTQVGTLLANPTYLEKVKSYAYDLAEKALSYEGILAWKTTGTLGQEIFPTLGASHGSAGIAMALYEFGGSIGDLELADFAVEVIKSLFKYGLSHSGNFLRSDVHPLSATKGHGQWCHGSAGLLWCILVAGMYDREEIRPIADWAADHFLDHPISGNPTMCHGLGGQLETAMMLTAIPKYSNRSKAYADRIASVLFAMKNQSRHLWPSEDPRKMTPDLWVGHMGPTGALNLWLQGGVSSILQAKRFI